MSVNCPVWNPAQRFTEVSADCMFINKGIQEVVSPQLCLLLNCPPVKGCLGRFLCKSVIRMPQYRFTLYAVPYSGLGI